MLELGEELRREGVAIGTSELLDAFAVLGEIDWTEQEDFREALAATLAKSQEDRRVFDLVFERFFFRAVECGRRSRGHPRARTAGELGEPPSRSTSTSCARRSPRRCRRRRGRAARPRAAGDRRASRARQEGSGVVGVDVQRIRRALGLRTEPQPELPAGRPAPRRAAARRAAALRGDAAPRARARADRAHADAAAVAPARRARPRAAVGPARRPRGRAPRRRPAAPAPGHAGRAERAAPPPRARRRPPHDARVAADRRRAGRAQVPPAAPAAPGDLRALRRLDERHLGVGLLPLGAARAARHVPPDALVRVHRADLRGHRHLRARAQLQGGQRRDRRATPASPTSPATPTTAASGRSSARWSRTTCTRARP